MTKLTAPIRSAAYANPVAQYLSTLSLGSSRATQASALDNVLRLLTPAETIDEFCWHRVPYEQWLWVRDSLGKALAPATANRYLAAVRGVLKASWRMRLLTTDEFMRLADLPEIPGYRKARRRALSQNEMARLYQAVRQGRTEWVRRRDAAILAVMYAAGIRRSEVVHLQLHDVRFEDDGTICMRVLGKGNKERDVWISGQIRPILEAWYAVRGSWRGVLFPGKKNNKKAMWPDNITHRIRHLAQCATLGHLSAHDLRRTCISTLLHRGVDLIVVRDIAGHSDITTTAKYDLRGERAIREAARKLPIPFK